MAIQKIQILLLFMFTPLSVFSQQLTSYQWKNRLVLIHTVNSQNPLFNKQVLELENHLKGLEERRIVVFKFLPGLYQKGFDDASSWEKFQENQGKYGRTETDFEIILVGLDGSVKLRKNDILSAEDLFKTIDQMPMRQSEIRKKKDGSNF
ncbi:DUF4174 domain-containing protein [Algoriphagus aestuarii]|nr:DUF4174 domain-containing protein [Algoriphagus aestuarii]